MLLFASALVLSATIGACAKKEDSTPTPAPVVDLTFVSSNLNASDQISSKEALVLSFSKDIKSTTVNQTNIILKNEDGSADIDSSKYSVVADADDASKIKVSLLDENLKETTRQYQLVIGALEDGSGKAFKDGDQSSKIINFTFLESLAPSLKRDNLGSKKQIRVFKQIKLVFSEPINMDSVTTDNISLQDGSGNPIDVSKYELIKGAKDGRIAAADNRVGILIKEDALDLRKTTANYKIKISAIKDTVGNLFVNPTDQSDSQTIDLTIQKDDRGPRFVGSNIVGDKILTGANKVALVFSSKLASSAKDNISMTKSGTAFTNFNATLSADAKGIDISFTDNTELDTVSTSYQVILGSEILDLLDNKLENPQTITFDGKLEPTTDALYVKAEAAGTKNGDSWANAMDLASAITEANTGTKKSILVAQGSYTPDTQDETKSFAMADGVKIYGGFTEQETANTARNYHKSILEGDISPAANAPKKIKTLIKADSTVKSGVLDGFKIQNGFNTEKGAGMQIDGATLTLSNLYFTNNAVEGTSSKGEGGALAVENSANITMKNVKFKHNSSSFRGGALYLHNSTINATDLVFEENSALMRGGAVFMTAMSAKAGEKSLLNINKSLFKRNTMDEKMGKKQNYGAAIYVDEKSQLQGTNLLFFENNGAVGAGIYASVFVKVNISNSTFVENSSQFINPLLDQADENSMGGALFITNESLVNLYNTILWNNRGDAELNSGINNIYSDITASSTINIKNSVLNANSATVKNGGDTSKASYIANVTNYDFITDATSKELATITDGSETFKVTGNFANNKSDDPELNTDFSLKATSVAKDNGADDLYLQVYNLINGGSAATIPATEKDLAQKARKVGASLDIGAYEVQ